MIAESGHQGARSGADVAASWASAEIVIVSLAYVLRDNFYINLVCAESSCLRASNSVFVSGLFPAPVHLLPSGKIIIPLLAWTNQWCVTVHFRCSLLVRPRHDVTHRALELTEVVDAAWRHITCDKWQEWQVTKATGIVTSEPCCQGDLHCNNFQLAFNASVAHAKPCQCWSDLSSGTYTATTHTNTDTFTLELHIKNAWAVSHQQ